MIPPPSPPPLVDQPTKKRSTNSTCTAIHPCCYPSPRPQLPSLSLVSLPSHDQKRHDEGDQRKEEDGEARSNPCWWSSPPAEQARPSRRSSMRSPPVAEQNEEGEGENEQERHHPPSEAQVEGDADPNNRQENERTPKPNDQMLDGVRLPTGIASPVGSGLIRWRSQCDDPSAPCRRFNPAVPG